LSNAGLERSQAGPFELLSDKLSSVERPLTVFFVPTAALLRAEENGIPPTVE
jgi:hypothetical protein